MGAVSLLHFRRVPMPRAVALISLAALLAALALLAFAAAIGLINPGLSPGSDPVLVAPFRWFPQPGGA